MGHRLSKIYTRGGDNGTTGLADGSRLAKDAPRIGAMGDVDELNSLLGLMLASDMPKGVRDCLIAVQHDLFNLGGELSLPDQTLVTEDDVARLEQQLDAFNQDLPPLAEFILPGGGEAAARCHLARAVCRRAERAVIALARESPVNESGRAYLNRLSDLLFVCCRVLAKAEGQVETLWHNPGRDAYD